MVLAFALALLLLAFLFVEETSYDRKSRMLSSTPPSGSIILDDNEKPTQGSLERTEAPIPERTPFIKTLSLWGRHDPDVPFFMTIVRSFTYFLVPQVFWVITSFGIYIGLGAFAFNYTFPIKITNPPYNWTEVRTPPLSVALGSLLILTEKKKQEDSGLLSVATLIAFVLAVPFAPTSDRLAARLTRRNNGVREAEMRLGVMIPAMVIAPAGLILYGLTAERNLHWIGYFFGGGMTQWAGYFYFSFALAYAVDSYNANTSEMLIAMNLGKQAISFGLSVNLLDWVLDTGYAVVISGIFCAVLVLNNFMLIVFMIWGKEIRKSMAGSWLAKFHGRHANRDIQVA